MGLLRGCCGSGATRRSFCWIDDSSYGSSIGFSVGVCVAKKTANVSQDEIYLQVIRDSGDGTERKHAAKVLRLLKRGKHWVLVTLLLGNVITNETLPIVLDRSLGGGWPAVLGSTVLIGMRPRISVRPTDN